MSFNAASVVKIVRQAICFSPRMHAYKFLHRDVIDRWASRQQVIYFLEATATAPTTD